MQAKLIDEREQRDVGLEHITEGAVVDPLLRDARSKVKFILHPDLSGEYLKALAQVVIKTKDGKEFSQKKMHPLGHPTDPLTIDQFKGLYAKFCRGILTEKVIAKTEEMILNLEKLSNIKELMNMVI